MGVLTTALYESFNMEEDFQDEVLDSLEDNGSLQEDCNKENMDESLNESVWDMIAPALDINESLNESTEIENAIDKYQELLRKDIPPARAKAMVTGKEEVQESLNESAEIKESADNKYDPKAYMKRVVERFKKEAKFPLDEQLTEEKLKNEGWRIKNVAMKAAIPSSALKEALLEGSKNEN